MLFSVCRDCYDDLIKNIQHFEVQDDVCSFCEQFVEVKKFSGYEDSLFFSDIFICATCFDKMKNLINIDTSE